MVHPTFVLICGSKYLLVWRLGASHVLGMVELLPGGNPAKQEDMGSGDEDSSCWECRPQRETLNQCWFPSDPQGNLILKLQDPEKEASGQPGLIPGLPGDCFWFGSNSLALCCCAPRLGLRLFWQSSQAIATLSSLQVDDPCLSWKDNRDLSNRISNLDDWKVRKKANSLMYYSCT